MCEMKCPICQNNLHKINIVVSTCTNDKCKLWGSPIPNLVLEALAQTKQDLEQSEKCCSAWETQALDYKAENIALSGELDRTREALDRAKLILKNLLPDLDGYERLDVEKSIAEITALTKGGDNDKQ